jgi:hypothetical protein
MTPKAAMVLTGKRALDYSGSVSADDNFGIGGYDRIMGLNGQAQYWARDIDEASFSCATTSTPTSPRESASLDESQQTTPSRETFAYTRTIRIIREVSLTWGTFFPTKRTGLEKKHSTYDAS